MRTCSLGPSPDDTSTIFALFLPFSGVLFSLSSCPSDGEPLLFIVLAAELDPSFLDVLESAFIECRAAEVDKLRQD